MFRFNLSHDDAIIIPRRHGLRINASSLSFSVDCPRFRLDEDRIEPKPPLWWTLRSPVVVIPINVARFFANMLDMEGDSMRYGVDGVGRREGGQSPLHIAQFSGAHLFRISRPTRKSRCGRRNHLGVRLQCPGADTRYIDSRKQ
jgi:hypothetical protein